MEERVKQLEGKDKANNKRISKLENLVRNLSSQTNHDEVVSSSIETSNTEYQLDENITFNIPTSNKFSPFQTMQDCSSTNTALPLENRLPLNSVPISYQGQISTRSSDIYQTKPLMPRYQEVRAQPHSENTSSAYSFITNSWSSLVPAHQETKSRTFPYQPMRQVNNSITETQKSSLEHINHCDSPTWQPLTIQSQAASNSYPQGIHKNENLTVPQTKIISPPSIVTNTQSKEDSNQNIDSDMVILIDSNGRFLKTQDMFPEKSSTKIGCPLIEHANEIILDSTFQKEPEIFIIHTGTNDLERSNPDDIQEKLIDLCDIIRNKFKRCRIILSLLLPRNDIHGQKVKNCNELIKNAFHRVDNLELLDNQNIFEIGDKALYDTKHLHKQTGLPQFISNISSVLGRENAWIKTKGHGQVYSHDNRTYSQSRRSPVKKHNVSDRSTFFSENGRGRRRNTQTVYSTIQDEQITTHTQNEEIKKLLTMIYDKMN